MSQSEEWSVSEILEQNLGIEPDKTWPIMSLVADDVVWAPAEPDVGIMSEYVDDCFTSLHYGTLKTTDWRKGVDAISHITGIESQKIDQVLSATVRERLEGLEPE